MTLPNPGLFPVGLFSGCCSAAVPSHLHTQVCTPRSAALFFCVASGSQDYLTSNLVYWSVFISPSAIPAPLNAFITSPISPTKRRVVSHPGQDSLLSASSPSDDESPVTTLPIWFSDELCAHITVVSSERVSLVCWRGSHVQQCLMNIKIYDAYCSSSYSQASYSVAEGN